jgi:hypothetical protein
MSSQDSTITDAGAAGNDQATGAPQDTLTVTDNRTGKSYELPIQDGTVRAIYARSRSTRTNSG